MNKGIAIIGMSCRFPGSPSIETYWDNISRQKNCISNFEPADQAEASPDRIYARGTIGNIDQFAAAFFGMTPREAEIMDPQHRLFLECAWETFENAGYNPETYEGVISVYASSNVNDYLADASSVFETPSERFFAKIHNQPDFLPTRVSHKFNLMGESMAVQTACSSSLVAVHMACQSILNGMSNMALVGGANIVTPEETGYDYQEGMILSRDGVCRPFDHRASGSVEGNGVGVVLLKSLEEAQRDGDSIYAVIRGSAINNDGSQKAGYTAPSIIGQAEVIAMALAEAEVPADSIRYLEAHGTATPLGDTVEIEGLTQAYHCFTHERQFCALGALKANFGHMAYASGIAGLIKMALSLYHRTMPGIVNFEQPNPEITFQTSPFYVNRETKPWTEEDSPRRGAVSSFGIGGTNCHVVLEEAPLGQERPRNASREIVSVSACTLVELKDAVERLKHHCILNPEISLADLAYTLHLGRKEFQVRWSTAASSIEDLVAQIHALQVADFKVLENQRARKDLQSARYMDDRDYLKGISDLWLEGAQVNWKAFYEQETSRRRIPLPTYPFQRASYWLSRRESAAARSTIAEANQRPASYATLEDIEKEVHKVFERNLGMSDFQYDEDLFELGGDSLLMAEVLTDCEKKLGVKLTIAEGMYSPSVRGLAEVFYKKIVDKEKEEEYSFELMLDNETVTFTVKLGDLDNGFPEGAMNIKKLTAKETEGICR